MYGLYLKLFVNLFAETININAWRAKKDVWHSPNNDVHFGVRVKDVSMYEYRVGQPAAPKAEEEKVEAEVAAEAQAKAEA